MKTMKQKWELREKHEKEVRAVLVEDGCMDKQNRLRAWHKQTGEKLRAKGHDSLSFDKCKCSEAA